MTKVNVKVSLPDQSKTAVGRRRSPALAFEVDGLLMDDLWWGGVCCRSGHQQGDQQAQRRRGEPT